MKILSWVRQFWPLYLFVAVLCICLTLAGSRTVSVLADHAADAGRTKIVIDPGHGGEDGGAISCTGIPESGINLDISLRLQDMMHLMGYDTVMIRRSDTAVYTTGKTIAEKKVSDLKQRVQIANAVPNALLVSIHQNQFSDGRYAGAQVFYAKTAGSQLLAEQMQAMLAAQLYPGSRRKCKKADNVYLMEHISCTGILIECGFLSNPEEEALLRTAAYQKKLVCVIGTVLCNFLTAQAYS